jgi:hypothetical protein
VTDKTDGVQFDTEREPLQLHSSLTMSTPPLAPTSDLNSHLPAVIWTNINTLDTVGLSQADSDDILDDDVLMTSWQWSSNHCSLLASSKQRGNSTLDDHEIMPSKTFQSSLCSMQDSTMTKTCDQCVQTCDLLQLELQCPISDEDEYPFALPFRHNHSTFSKSLSKCLSPIRLRKVKFMNSCAESLLVIWTKQAKQVLVLRQLWGKYSSLLSRNSLVH